MTNPAGDLLPEKLILGFIQDTVPEYFLDEARTLANDENALRASLKRDGNYYELVGTVQGDDFQIYSPRLSLSRSLMPALPVHRKP